MLANYATFRQSMRIMMEGIMRTMSKVKKSVNVSLPPEILEEARKLKLNLLGGINRSVTGKNTSESQRNLVARKQRIRRRS